MLLTNQLLVSCTLKVLQVFSSFFYFSFHFLNGKESEGVEIFRLLVLSKQKHSSPTLVSAEWPSSCSDYKQKNSSLKDGNYVIDPDGEGGVTPFTVLCNMSDEAGVGVTVISHDSEQRTLVNGFEEPGSYSRNVKYTGANLTQLAGLTQISIHCEQFIRYECFNSLTLHGDHAWLVSRDGVRMTYWGGASPGSKKCACGMNNTCVNPIDDCNCDANDAVWREDSGLLTHKPDLPVSQLRFGDTGSSSEKGYHTLGKMRCYGRSCTSNPCLNGGTCIVLLEGYNCSCAVGFTGSRCEEGSFLSIVFEIDPNALLGLTLSCDPFVYILMNTNESLSVTRMQKHRWHHHEHENITNTNKTNANAITNTNMSASNRHHELR